MPSSGSGCDGAGGQAPHIVLLPCAEMAHLVPFGRLAAALTSSAGGHGGCDVSMAVVLPTVSFAESAHIEALFAACPAVRRLEFHLPPFDASEFPAADPFFLRWNFMRRSAPHLLGPLLAGARASVLITDIVLASVAIPVARELGIPCYVFFISSTAMLSLCAYFPTYLDAVAGAMGDVDIPGVYRVPKSSVPQALLDPGHLFTQQFIDNGRVLGKAAGVLVNTFDAFEPEVLAALREGSVVAGFPPVYSVGPLAPVSFATEGEPAKDPGSYMEWLDAQPARSVVFVSFGSRPTISKDQLRELAGGLEASGHRFLWVVKSTVVDRDDTELGELVGDGFLERVQGRGVVTKGWVEQEVVLKHESVGLFVSHSGWNSVTEAAASGVPVLAWPRGGDQPLNARAMARGGLGVWMERWSWEGEEGVVSAEEIAEKVKEVMADETVTKNAASVREAAARALADGGTSHQSLAEFVRRCWC